VAGAGPAEGAALDARLLEYLPAGTQALAQTTSLFGNSITDVFVSPSLITRGGIPTDYRAFLRLLREPGKQLLVTGAPGSGKSWLLRHCAIDLASEWMLAHGAQKADQSVLEKEAMAGTAAPIPLYLPLRNLRMDLPIVPAISQSAGLDLSMIERVMREHRLILLFDGLDEVLLQERPMLIDRINSLCRENRQITSVVSTRPIEASGFAIESDHEFALSDLSDSSVLDFIRGYGDQRVSGEILDFVKSGSGGIFRTPLLVSLLSQLMQGDVDLPEKEETLFDMVIETLLYRHDATKPGYQRKFLLKHSEIRDLVSMIALMMVVQNVNSLPRADFEELVERSLLPAGIEQLKVDSRWSVQITKDLIRLGLVKEDSSGGLGFLHRALQEHLAVAGASGLPKHEDGFAHFLVRLARANLDAALPTKLARGWMRSPSQGQALLKLLDAEARTENERTAAVLRTIAASLQADVDRLKQRDEKIFRSLDGLD
jgi:hypothetical protein